MKKRRKIGREAFSPVAALRRRVPTQLALRDRQTSSDFAFSLDYLAAIRSIDYEWSANLSSRGKAFARSWACSLEKRHTQGIRRNLLLDMLPFFAW